MHVRGEWTLAGLALLALVLGGALTAAPTVGVARDDARYLYLPRADGA